MKTPKNKPWNFCETPEEKCTMNYCNENGCQNRKRNLVELKKSKAATFILGQIDKAIEKSNLEQQIEKLEAEKAELLELKSTIEEFRDKANQSADNLHKRGLQSSGMCSQAMETAYNLCLIEIESLIQKHKQ